MENWIDYKRTNEILPFGVTTPAGLENVFAEQSAYFGSLQGPPDPERIREIGDRYGVRALGPPVSSE